MSMASQPVSTTLTEALISRTEDVETGVVRGTKVGVKQTGKTVKVDQYCFARGNFYIEQSQQYFKGRKLTRYVYFSKFFTLCIHRSVDSRSCWSSFQFYFGFFDDATQHTLSNHVHPTYVC